MPELPNRSAPRCAVQPARCRPAGRPARDRPSSRRGRRWPACSAYSAARQLSGCRPACRVRRCRWRRPARAPRTSCSAPLPGLPPQPRRSRPMPEVHRGRFHSPYRLSPVRRFFAPDQQETQVGDFLFRAAPVSSIIRLSDANLRRVGQIDGYRQADLDRLCETLRIVGPEHAVEPLARDRGVADDELAPVVAVEFRDSDVKAVAREIDLAVAPCERASGRSTIAQQAPSRSRHCRQ